jgi:glycosyltransferase involved in cell wall biosynthesis
MTILEAQANGIPCVGLSEKGIPDLIKDGVNGLVVPNHDNEAFSRAIIKILASDDLQNLFRVGALREIKKHELSEVIVAWEKTYSKLAAASQ